MLCRYSLSIKIKNAIINIYYFTNCFTVKINLKEKMIAALQVILLLLDLGQLSLSQDDDQILSYFSSSTMTISINFESNQIDEAGQGALQGACERPVAPPWD